MPDNIRPRRRVQGYRFKTINVEALTGLSRKMATHITDRRVDFMLRPRNEVEKSKTYEMGDDCKLQYDSDINTFNVVVCIYDINCINGRIICFCLTKRCLFV